MRKFIPAVCLMCLTMCDVSTWAQSAKTLTPPEQLVTKKAIAIKIAQARATDAKQRATETKAAAEKAVADAEKAARESAVADEDVVVAVADHKLAVAAAEFASAAAKRAEVARGTGDSNAPVVPVEELQEAAIPKAKQNDAASKFLSELDEPKTEQAKKLTVPASATIVLKVKADAQVQINDVPWPTPIGTVRRYETSLFEDDGPRYYRITVDGVTRRIAVRAGKVTEEEFVK